MLLLRWIHLRKLVPIEDLISSAGGSAAVTSTKPVAPPAKSSPPGRIQSMAQAAVSKVGSPAPSAAPAPVAGGSRTSDVTSAPRNSGVGSGSSRSEGNFKDAFLAEIRKGKAVLYNMSVAQAQKIEIAGDRVTFTFASNQRALRDQVEQNQKWLEALASQVGGRTIAVTAVMTAPEASSSAAAAAEAPPDPKAELRRQALAEPGIQAMLEVFPAEIRDVEEM
jgi:hypothetical protein